MSHSPSKLKSFRSFLRQLVENALRLIPSLSTRLMTIAYLLSTFYSINNLTWHLSPLKDVIMLNFILFKLCYCRKFYFRGGENFTTQFCRIKGCAAVWGAPPPIIFERLKLPQQIIYRRKENLSESPNHLKYWKNILISRFYEQFVQCSRNLGHFRKLKKNSDY